MPKSADASIVISIAPFASAFTAPVANQNITLTNISPTNMAFDPGKTNSRRVAVTPPTGSGTSSYTEGSISISAPGTGNGRSLNLGFRVVEVQPSVPVPSGAPYMLVGLVFSGTGDLTGVNFPDFEKNSDGSLVVTDSDGNTSATTYEFLLLVQNNKGGIALIDPRIINVP